MSERVTNIDADTKISLSLRLLLDKADLTANGLAVKLNLPTPTIHRLLIGDVKDPRASTLMSIADYFAVSVDQLLGREPLELDAYSPQVRPPQSIPVLTMGEAVQHEKYIKTPGKWLRWQKQATEKHHASVKTVFGVTIKSNLYEPTFIKGTTILVDPSIIPEIGDYVLVHFKGDAVCVIKKFIAEGSHKYLYPIQSELKTLALNENDCGIIGVMFEAYINFKD